MRIELRPMSRAVASALLAGRRAPEVRFADDYPTEFSVGVAQQVGTGSPLGPWCIHRVEDGTIVGEIGGGLTGPGQAEVGYAVVRSCWGRGYATEALSYLIAEARRDKGIDRLVAHTPLDRPASGRVLEKNGFKLVGEMDDEHEGTLMRVKCWELSCRLRRFDPRRYP